MIVQPRKLNETAVVPGSVSISLYLKLNQIEASRPRRSFSLGVPGTPEKMYPIIQPRELNETAVAWNLFHHFPDRFQFSLNEPHKKSIKNIRERVDKALIFKGTKVDFEWI